MVQIRDSLPLLDGDAHIDSASMAAKLVAHELHPDFQQQLSGNKLGSNKLGSNKLSDTSLGNNSASSALKNTNGVALTVSDIDIEAWLKSVSLRIGQSDTPLLRRACHFVKDKNDQSKDNRRSGAYVTGIGMADILGYLFQDESALVAAMLYRLARHNIISHEDICQAFGSHVATLVKDTLAMGQLSESIEANKRLEDYFDNNNREHLSNIYSMLINTTNDVRAVLIKLAERTFAMRELSFAHPDRQKQVAREVMTIYAPLAHRLSIAQLKWELEDLAFSYLLPDEYKRIAKLLAEKRIEREAYIQSVQDALHTALTQAGIQGEISGRVKHIYSIWRKMKLKNLSFNQLYDIRALRVLVHNNAECYHTLGIVHGLWKHIPEQFDDYITNPKPNGYKSLHTAVIAQGKTLEIQIRTLDMHFEAELGVCAHVNYKEGLKTKKDDRLTQKISSLRQLLAGDKPNDTEDNDDDLNNQTRIYLFSRDGDIIELPKGATVLDFAYHVHTEVGNRAQGARVNGRYVPLTHQPKNGEQVEIITKSSRDPNRDWLIPSLGYIRTGRARSKLRQWFNKQDRDKNIETGRLMLNKEFDRLSIDEVNVNDIVTTLGLKGTDELYLGLVMGEIGLGAAVNVVLDKLVWQVPDTKEITLKTPTRPNKYKIDLDGLDNVDIHLAGCCNPIYGESIAGYITTANGVSIHNCACTEYHRLIQQEPQRAIRAYWQDHFGRYQPVIIHLEAYDRRGLLRDLTGIIDKEKVNIQRAETLSTDDNIAHMKFSIEVAGLPHLSRLLAKLEQQPGVIHARRAGS